MNKAILMGRLSADPELKTTESGISKCRFTVAVQEDYKNKDGSRDVDFITCIAWRSTADYVCKYFKKGSRIAVIGRNKCEVYEKDGKKHFYSFIRVESVEFAGYNKPAASGADEPEMDFTGFSEADFAAEFDEIVSEESPF